MNWYLNVLLKGGTSTYVGRKQGSDSDPDKTAHITGKAKSLGASLAGIAGTLSLQSSPSSEAYGEFDMPTGDSSVLVLALAHEKTRPNLDWWDGEGGSPGNRRLIEVAENLVNWLREEFNVSAHSLPYHVEDGGIFLKDAAVLAGLGVIGRNNLVVTPKFGARVRFRALLLEVDLAPISLRDFAPCDGCETPCRRACPRKAFEDGSYRRPLCNIQMRRDEADKTDYGVKYCRACELACPVAR